MLREAKAMARLAHPNVVHVYEVDEFGDAVFLAMELVAGLSLRQWLKLRPRKWRDVLAVFLQAMRPRATAPGTYPGSSTSMTSPSCSAAARRPCVTPCTAASSPSP
jgi:hypothetical protein